MGGAAAKPRSNHSPSLPLQGGEKAESQSDRLSAGHFLAPPPDRTTGLPVARNHGFPPRHDFDAMGVSQAGVQRKAVAPAGYDLEGAFWELGAAVGRAMAREAVREPVPLPAPAAAATGHAPLVTVIRHKQRVVVAAACPVARALGLTPGMALTQARMMVPGLDVRDADPAGEAADLARLGLHAARHWTPLAMPAEGCALWLDITASAHLFGGEERLSRRILGFCRKLGLTARIAIADTPAAAHALAASGAGVLIASPAGADMAATASLPLGLLRLPETIVEAVRRLGIETIGALAAMPRAPLVRRFGTEVGKRLDQLAGIRAEPIEPVVPAAAPSIERRFFEPVLTVEGLSHALGGLAEGLVAMLAMAGLGARMLVLRLVRIDNHAQTIAIGLARASRDAGHMARLLRMRIEEIEPGFGIEAATLTAVRADALEAEAIDGPLSGKGPADDLAVLIDRLATRLGARGLYRIGMVESEVPERSIARHPPLILPPAWTDPWPRPTRLLDPPERVHDVIALLPDHPPRRFTWRGRAHRVTRGDGPERVFGEWWRRGIERDAVRDYFRVEDEEGQRFWLFRRGDGVDQLTGDLSWHVHGVFG